MDALARLKNVFDQRLKGKSFFITSHSEPYIHFYKEDELVWRKAVGGLVAALDPLMQKCGGTWIAYGAGAGDREASDKNGVENVPPGEGKYLLKHVWLERREIENYLDGAANSMLWPLHHFCYVRPRFEEKWWSEYVKVNKKFADAVVEAVGDSPGLVWVHDYQLALCSKFIKDKRPDLVVAQFWHIPWPVADIYKICPWATDIVEALLANDLVGFQISYHANNFLDAVDQLLQARVDRENSCVFYKDTQTRVMNFPISIDFRQLSSSAEKITPDKIRAVRKRYGLGNERILLGVDRKDYTKGIPEKLAGFDRFLEENPDYAGKVSLVQVASPSRVHVPEYAGLNERINEMADEINWRHSANKWRPVVLIQDFVAQEELVALYSTAEACLVTSLRDGMNLVSKEFVAAKNDGDGVLVLSRFTGAARELTDAVLVNPYHVGEVATAIKKALEMPAEERKNRMVKCREVVAENDVYKWAADFIEKISRLEATPGT